MVTRRPERYAAASGPQLPAALLAKLVQCAGGDAGDFLADADVDVNAAIAHALDIVCDHIATDAAKGFAPFGPGGIAGPESVV